MRRRRAVAAVEFALTVPALLLMVTSSFELALYFQHHGALVQATRDATHTAALASFDDGPASVARARAADVLRAAGFDPDTAVIEVEMRTTPYGPAITVEITADHDRISSLLDLPDTLTAELTMLMEAR